MTEFELIHHLTRSLPSNKHVVTSAGDDCAILDLGVPDRLFLFKTDAVVEGDRAVFDLDVVERKPRCRIGGPGDHQVDQVLDVVAPIAIASTLWLV